MIANDCANNESCSVVGIYGSNAHNSSRLISLQLYSALFPLDILTQTVSSNFLPLHLLSRDRKLSPESLECPLCHLKECLVQLLLIVALDRSNARDNRLGRNRGYGDIDGLVGVESHISVFVVVYVDVDLAGHGCGLGGDGDLVDGSESTVPAITTVSISSGSHKDQVSIPEIVGRVAVCNQKNGDGRVILDGIDTVGAVGVMFTSVDGQRLEERFTRSSCQQ